MNEGKNLLTIEQFASKVNYSQRHVRQMCIDGKIKAHKLTAGSRKWLIPKSELNKFGDETKAALEKESRLERVPEVAPIIIEAKKKHFVDMAAIAEALLANGLDTLRRHTITSSEGSEKYEYSTMIGDDMEFLSHEQLVDRLRVNWGLKWNHMNKEDTERFLAHLKADYRELESQDIPTIIAENPYELIETLRVLIRRGTLKGKCGLQDICVND